VERTSPRDRFITVFGRMPVLEALQSPRRAVAKVVVADNARGGSLDEIVGLARERGVEVELASPMRVKLLAGNGKQDQGVVADVTAPRMARLETFLSGRPRGPQAVFVLDGVTNPANVGMILRSATAAGIDGVVLPRSGTPHVGPLVIKASAGVAFDAPILNIGTAREAADLLRRAGFTIYGLAATARSSLFDTAPAERSAFVFGGETSGLTISTDVQVRIPMRNHVESLNVAVAASIAAFHVAGRPAPPRRASPARRRRP
jgi:23S rRNA (guanosine2251-2'-O)-methyltransferase